MRILTPTIGPNSPAIATQGRSTCRTDALSIARPTCDVGGLHHQLEHLIALPDPRRPSRDAAGDVDRDRSAVDVRHRARRTAVRHSAALHSCEQTVTGAHRSPRAARAVLWLPGLAVALGAAVATAHGLYEVALAAAVPAGIAWLYPLITDGLALVAYGATARLTGSARPLRLGGRRHRGRAVRARAGRLPRLRRHPRRLPGPAVRDRGVARRRRGGRRAPAVPPGRPDSAEPIPQANPRSRLDSTRGVWAPFSRSRPTVQPSNPRYRRHWTRLDVQARQACHVQPRRPPVQTLCRRARRPRRGRGRAPPPYGTPTRHGTLPTVSALATAADVSRGTAATVLKPLRGRPPAA